MECFLLALLCLAIDIVIWRAHWNMTYEDAGFVNDSQSVIKASNLSKEDFIAHVDEIISKITGLPKDSDYWPALMIKRCAQCKILKTAHVHHCSVCKKCVFMMDHHCCFSDRCVGYYSMKPFIFFTGGVTLLTCVGLSTICYNLTERLDELHEGGLQSFADVISAFWNTYPEKGRNYWTMYDMLLIQFSMFNGIWAFAMLLFLFRSIQKNESQIDSLKKG